MRTRERHFGGVPRLLGLVLLGLAGPSLGQEPPPKPERLSRADIQAAVMPHKPEVVECVKTQRELTPNVQGETRVVMRWTIQPDGKTANVTCVSGCELRFASCIGEKIKSWTFPEHQVQGEPLDYPFAF